ncbi:beta-N-acetylhexosaminidase [Pedobacter rhizosphaerae]|uniref:beta-N-acetylhexosaminidase n=1 Tax=Pedobacter rhizosphaerae TaxID=390241 RepID=A0A1H9KPV1_9SPHI|nr:beta-N-acetylhexosaminidase [Pedobacter rhizosphaerae]SER00947.1 hexosaminidase [Pedobacter rhizosphaerae]
MRNILLICLLLWGKILTAQELPAIVPYPQELKINEGHFELNRYATVYTNDHLTQEANYLRQSLFELSGINYLAGTDNKASIVLILKKGKKATSDEGYHLTISSTQVVIEGATANGVFNGIQTLLQLLKGSKGNKTKVALQALEIKDEPLYAWRGFMLDESRHFFGKEKVKSLLNWMALYKLNQFHWHLTDEPAWRLEVRKYPKLILIGGIGNYTDANQPAQYYSQEDVKEIIAYAAARFITVIPEIDMPGHATAANMAYPAYSGGGSKDHPEFTFNPGYEKTYQYLTDILNETQLLFPSNMIHLGGDEVSFGNEKWKTDTAITALKRRVGLASDLAVEKYFMKRMADSVFAMKSKVLAWDEMVDAGLPVDKTIIFWWRHDKPEQLNQALAKGYQTVLCPRLPLYFDFIQDANHQYGRKWGGKVNDLLSVYHFDVSKSLKNNEDKKHILGIQANLWTETAQNEQRLDYLVFPRIASLAEAAWSLPVKRNDQEFLSRLRTHLKWYRDAGLNFYNPDEPMKTPEPASRRKVSQNIID